MGGYCCILHSLHLWIVPQSAHDIRNSDSCNNYCFAGICRLCSTLLSFSQKVSNWYVFWTFCRHRFVFNFWWLISLFTALDVLVPTICGNYTPYLGFLRFIRFYTLAKYDTGHFRLSEFTMRILQLAFTIIAALLTAAGLINIKSTWYSAGLLFLLENVGNPKSWVENQKASVHKISYYTGFYVVVTTITTIGGLDLGEE